MKLLRECRLYTFVDTAYLAGRDPAVVVAQLCDGGSDLIQLRAKGMPVDAVWRIAEKLLPITERADVGLVINDHLGVALGVGAPACHLGQEDFFGAGLRHVSSLIPSGGGLTFGLSTHSPEQAQSAVAAGADYIAVGPVFPTGTKPGAKAVTLDYVRWAVTNVTIPWFAIGGINLGTLGSVVEAGARRICVVSAILNAADIVKACQAFRNLLLSKGCYETDPSPRSNRATPPLC